MRRGDMTVLSVTAALAAVVVAAVVVSVTVLDRAPNTTAMVSDDSASSLLVLTWAPTFCAMEEQNPACASGEVAKAGQTLVLHGLWPQPRDREYCGLPESMRNREADWPPVQLSDDVRGRMQSVSVDTAALIRHEWYTHGTCSGVSPDTYFGDAATLASQVRTVLDPVLRDASGGRLTLAAVRARVDQALGAGAGERVGFGCRTSSGQGAVIADVRLSMPPVVALPDGNGAVSLADSILKAPPIPAQCRHGSVL